MYDLYNTIDSLCKARGITITRMCQEAGISRAPLSDLKVGRTKMLSPEKLDRIANYFNVTVDYLLGKEEDNDEFIAFYGTVKGDLTQDDIDDLKVSAAAKAERNRKRKSGE